MSRGPLSPMGKTVRLLPRGGGLDVLELPRGMGGRRVVEGRDPGYRRGSLLEELEPLRRQVGVTVHQPRDPPAGARNAWDEPRPNGVGVDRHHDGELHVRFLNGNDRGSAADNGDVNRQTDQLSRQLRQPLCALPRIPLLDDQVLSFDVSQLPQPLPEGGHERLFHEALRQVPDSPDAFRLRRHSARCQDEGHAPCDEHAPVHH